MRSGPELSLSREIASLLRLVRIHAEPVAVAPSSAELLDEMERLRGTLASRYAGRAPAEIEGLAPARELYRSFHVDPTRARPSSEALLRRLLQGKPLPSILNAVDLCNLLSLQFLLPLGLYDVEKIQGPVHLRRGLAAESYAWIRKETVSHDFHAATLAGDLYPGAFPRSTLEEYSGTAREAIARHLSDAGAGVEIESKILP